MKRILLALAIVGCSVQHDVPIDIVGLDRGRPQGFGCRAPSAMGGGPLLTQIVAPDLAPCSMACDTAGSCRTAAYVFDFVELGGVPSCGSSALVEWCSGDPSRCHVTARRCFDVDACVVGSGTSSAASVEAGLREAANGVILDPAPDGFVLVRLVGSAQSCAQIESTGVSRREVFGCVYSCPEQLDGVMGAVQLGLDSGFNDECGALVYGCATFLTGEQPVMP